LLTPGTRLGPYEVQDLVGTGGMGEVYRARDSRLDRIVAVKVLKPELAEAPGFRQRFEREARAISQLTHPHICTLHDVGQADGASYLVMEYVEGERLDVRLERGPLPIDQALAIGVQVAQALDKAHRNGIVHGDLKPGNVMLTRTGVKLLDFGLARRLPSPEHLPSDSETQVVPVPETPMLGTLPYLAPEQLEGRPPDARSDLFAFGALLYEVLTGRRAFAADSHAGIVSAIMRAEPPPLRIARPEVTPALERLVNACLAKDPDERWQSAGDLARELRWVASADAEPASAGPGGRVRSRLWAGAAAALALSTIALAAIVALGDGATPERAIRTSVLLPEEARFPGAGQLGGGGRFALSPDGRRIAFVATDANGSQLLWVRPLDSMVATPLPGSDGAGSPFWAPDSERIAFVADGQLKVLRTSGGEGDSAPRVLGPASNATGSWSEADLILYSPSPGSPLFVVPASGGMPRAVTELDPETSDVLHRNGVFLPGGRRFLYVAVSSRTGETTQARAIYAGSVDDPGPGEPILESGSTVAYGEGHLLFMQGNRLLAQPFDPDSLELTGAAVPVTERIELTGPSTGAFAVVGDLLAYQPVSGPVSQLVWLDRDGQQVGVLGEPDDYGDIDLSPSGDRAVVSVLDLAANTRDLWVFDVVRGVRTRLTLDPGDDISPAWSSDGSQIAFASNRSGNYSIYVTPASGVGGAVELLANDGQNYPTSWSANRLLFWTFSFGSNVLFQLEPTSREVTPFPAPFVNTGRFSPDGGWIAYSSSEAGRPEVSVVSFPNFDRRWQLSVAGGNAPQWRNDGRELYFSGRDNAIMAVTLAGADGAGEPGVPVPLFVARPVGRGSFFDVAPDGERFLVNTYRGGSLSSSITILQHWSTLVQP
jgi:Tol biopolymer transport system component